MLSSNNDMPGLVHIQLCTIKMKPGWTSDEGQTLKHLLNVLETPIQALGPHPSAQMVPGGNYFIHHV